jgi:predicted AlkP superfamily phosphohydrolase/phosphomutase
MVRKAISSSTTRAPEIIVAPWSKSTGESGVLGPNTITIAPWRQSDSKPSSAWLISALPEEKIDEKVFLEDLFRNMDAVESALVDQLTREKPALTVAAFLAADHASHTFFRFLDPEHPRYDAALVPQFGDAILRTYRRMDSIIGRVLAYLGDRGTLIVVSDHGFHTWRREFNTNTWLARNGFLAMKSSTSDGTVKKLDDMFSGGSFFPNVDWSRSRAYSLGLGGIFINVRDREGQGVVPPGREYDQVRSEIMMESERAVR